jgi:hypothetical protein
LFVPFYRRDSGGNRGVQQNMAIILSSLAPCVKGFALWNAKYYRSIVAKRLVPERGL